MGGQWGDTHRVLVHRTLLFSPRGTVNSPPNRKASLSLPSPIKQQREQYYSSRVLGLKIIRHNNNKRSITTAPTLSVALGASQNAERVAAGCDQEGRPGKGEPLRW